MIAGHESDASTFSEVSTETDDTSASRRRLRVCESPLS